jgi:uncharacterized integral membrane protein (TIGR00698 family)
VTKFAETTTLLLSCGVSACACVKRLGPGLLASLTIGLAATFLSEHYGGPAMLFALLLGMAFYFLSREGRCVPGIAFASSRILRVAVGLLGAQITVSQIIALGVAPVATVIFAVGVTILFGVLTARVLRLGTPFGLLTAGAVAICGVSAALAISLVLPKTETRERDTAFTVIGVTTLSTIAMILYPPMIAFFRLDDAAIGIVLGGTIHDVAQVVGAGYSVSERTGDVATYTKLLRVAMLMPLVLCLSLGFRSRDNPQAGRRLPGFLVVFACLVLLNSAGLIPTPALSIAKSLSRWCLVTAIAAIGMKTSLRAMAEVGGRSIALIVSETCFLAVLVLAITVWRF